MSRRLWYLQQYRVTKGIVSPATLLNPVPWRWPLAHDRGRIEEHRGMKCPAKSFQLSKWTSSYAPLTEPRGMETRPFFARALVKWEFALELQGDWFPETPQEPEVGPRRGNDRVIAFGHLFLIKGPKAGSYRYPRGKVKQGRRWSRINWNINSAQKTGERGERCGFCKKLGQCEIILERNFVISERFSSKLLSLVNVFHFWIMEQSSRVMWNFCRTGRISVKICFEI